MRNRIKDIEGSLLDSVSDELKECVTKSNIHYVFSFKHKKGIIEKAVFKNNVLDLYVSKGNIFEGILLCVMLFIVVTVIVSVIS